METDVETVARLKELRNRSTTTSAAKMTFGKAAELSRADIVTRRDIKPASKEYRLFTLTAILRTWPAVAETEIKRISDRDCEKWAQKYAAEYSPSRFNGTVQTLRAVFEAAIKHGAIASNPSVKIEAASVLQKELTLPTHAQFLKIIEVMDRRRLRLRRGVETSANAPQKRGPVVACMARFPVPFVLPCRWRIMENARFSISIGAGFRYTNLLLHNKG